MRNLVHCAILLLAFSSWTSILLGAPAIGVYAYVEMRGDADSTAKVREFSSAKRGNGVYYLRLMTGSMHKVSGSNFKGAVYYPSRGYRESLAALKNKSSLIRKFSMRFPASRRYLTHKQTALLQVIYQKEKPQSVSAKNRNLIKRTEKADDSFRKELEALTKKKTDVVERVPEARLGETDSKKKTQLQEPKSEVVKHSKSSSEIFNTEIGELAAAVSKAMQVSGKKRVVFARIFFNGGKTTSACSFLKRKVSMHLLNDSKIELFDRDDIAAKFEEDKLVFSLKGEGIPELASTDILLTGEVIALQDKNGVALSLRLIDIVTGELLAAPMALLPITDGLASRLKRNNVGALSSSLTSPTPENKHWLSQMKAKLPNENAKVIFADLPPCTDNQKLQLRLTRAFLLHEMKEAGVKLLEREFLYLIGGDPLAQNDPLAGFLQGDAMFAVNPDSSGRSNVFSCSARLTSSGGRLLYVTEFKFDYIAQASEAGSLAEASLEDALQKIQRDSKANDKSKLIYTRTWSLANGCQITKADWEKFENLDPEYSRIVYKITSEPFGTGHSISFDAENFQSAKNLNWSTTCREMIRRLALAQKSNTQSVKYTVITSILGGFSLREDWRDEGPWKDSNWVGLWPLLLNDALNDWTVHSSGSFVDGRWFYELGNATGVQFPQRLLYNHVLGVKTSHWKVPKMPLPKGSYTIKDSRVSIKLNYEITWKWKGLLPSEVTMTIDLTPSKNILYKVKK